MRCMQVGAKLNWQKNCGNQKLKGPIVGQQEGDDSVGGPDWEGFIRF